MKLHRFCFLIYQEAYKKYFKGKDKVPKHIWDAQLALLKWTGGIVNNNKFN